MEATAKATGRGVLCAVVVAGSIYLLGLGMTVLLGSPRRTGQGFWTVAKLVYGVLPICAVPIFVSAAFKRWAALFARRRNAWISWLALFAVAVSLEELCYLKLRNRQDERIYLNWHRDSGVFNWGPGEVKLPPGYTYAREHGIDTFVGRFTSDDGRLVIDYDIGELAAEHGGMGDSETLIGGSRVRVGTLKYTDDKGGTRYFSKVSFPDSGCAHFSIESPRKSDTEVIQFLAQNYRPKGQLPSLLRPLLPEVLRSDCR